MENLILFDWLSFTSRVDSVASVCELLGLHNIHFIDRHGLHGFLHCKYFDGISIHYDSDKYDGVWVEMCGEGCRAFETYSDLGFENLFVFLRDNTDDYHVTRLDVAFDDHSGLLNLRRMAADVDAINFVSRFAEKKIRYECAAGKVGYTIYCGSQKSDVMFRIYDKAFERDRVDEGHWVRFELQLRREHALGFMQALEHDVVGNVFYGVIANYIRFVTPNKTDSNKKRWKPRKYWSDFIGNAQAIRVFTPCKVEYNMAKCENYLYHQCGNALHTVATVKGWEAVIKDLKEQKPALSPKYKDLINSNNCIANDGILEYLAERGLL